MQKVVGSSPIIRSSSRKPRSRGVFSFWESWFLADVALMVRI
jgi:hypothetical protein